MTMVVVDPSGQIEVASVPVQRLLAIARRALRANEAILLGAGSEAPDMPGTRASLTAAVAPFDEEVATLVVFDEAARPWSDEDAALLRDIAATLGDVVRFAQIASRDAAPSAAETAAAMPEAGGDRAHDGADGSAMPRILLADDLDLNRKLICDMLSLDGYDVDSVADGAAAVEAVKAKSYDLVLMDMIMPGMDGMDATRAIRALPAPTCDVPIVALTAHSFREQLDDCLHAGMNATLTKPMSFEALSSAVSLWARSRRAA